MARRFSALLLICVIVFSVCSVPANASDDNITIIIDLSNYHGEITGGFTNFINDNGGVLVAGKVNTFSVDAYVSSKVSADFTLNDFECSSYKSWSISGSMGNGNSIESYIVDDKDNSQLIFTRDINNTINQVVIIGNHFSFVAVKQSFLRNNWSYGTTITFTPCIETNGDYLVTATSIDSNQGTASVTKESDQYKLTATAKDGYSFSHWLEEGIEDIPDYRIYSNPYFVTADTEITYVAYFRDRYFVNVLSENADKGKVSTEYIGAENGHDLYRLTAVPATYFKFSHWKCGEESYSANLLEIAVEDSNQSYVAYFTPIEFIVSDEGFLRHSGSITNGFTTTVSASTYGGIISSGCRSTLYIPVTIPEAMENVTVQLQITDANDRVLADYSETRSFSKRSGYLTASFDPTEANISTLTATVTLTTPVGSSIVSKTYSNLAVATGETNDDFHFITSPADVYSYVTIEQAGANITGAYAQIEENTKDLSLYCYGPGGVYAWDNTGSTNIRRLTGLSIGDGERVLALGPGSSDGLTAVKGSSTISLWKWDGESWTMVSGSSLSADQSQSGTKIALVMASDDVWTDTRHWNGEAWDTHSYGFVSFQRVSDTEAYGVDSSGSRWHYDGSSWTAAAALSAPETSSVTSTPVNGSTISLGQDHNGDWYLFVQSRNHFIDDSGWYSYDGSDVYKWDGSKWVYQIMSDFNDPNDDPMETRRRIRPDGVNGLCVPAPGVTLMYGTNGNGANYLYTDDVTITFNPGEGTLDNAALATLTAPILSAIDSSKVPRASRDGYTFGGWYYDEACTFEFDATNTAMPGESITLYAKYSDGNDPEAQLAWYKQKALKDLEKQFNKYSSSDYTAENWSALQSAYISGISAINNAEAGTAHIEDNVTAALNIAIAAMQAIEPKDTSKVTVAVSMDANTLGLGYILEPTLVTVDKGTPVSVVITDLLNQRAKAMGITTDGRTDKPNMEAIETLYPWSSSGTPTSGFYLAQVYLPDQTGYTVPDTIMNYITSNGLNFSAEDANGKYLGETDYLNTSGWQYSVGNKTNGAAEFPGIGSSGWSLSDGEVVRWQFTLVGYGADLGADNTAWGTSNILSVGDKSALTWKEAELRSQYSDATLKTYEVYNAALAVLTDAEAEQGAIDAALADLNGLVIPVPQEIPDEKIDITGEDTGSPVAEVTSEISPDGTATLHVTAANPCVVVVEKADGTYERLTATPNANGGYDFSQAGYTEAMEFHVLMKGDTNGNGRLDLGDCMQAKAAFLKKLDLDPLSAFAADLNGDGLKLGDVMQTKAAFLQKTTIDW